MATFGTCYSEVVGSDGLTQLMWRCLEVSYTFLSQGEGNARL